MLNTLGKLHGVYWDVEVALWLCVMYLNGVVMVSVKRIVLPTSVKLPVATAVDELPTSVA